jgi:hypothetical protein
VLAANLAMLLPTDEIRRSASRGGDIAAKVCVTKDAVPVGPSM